MPLLERDDTIRKDAYAEKLERRMWHLTSQLEKLTARAEAQLARAAPVTRALYDELTSTLQAQREWLRRRLGELRSLGEDGWRELADTIESGWREIDKNLHQSAQLA